MSSTFDGSLVGATEPTRLLLRLLEILCRCYAWSCTLVLISACHAPAVFPAGQDLAVEQGRDLSASVDGGAPAATDLAIVDASEPDDLAPCVAIPSETIDAGGLNNCAPPCFMAVIAGCIGVSQCANGAPCWGDQLSETKTDVHNGWPFPETVTRYYHAGALCYWVDVKEGDSEVTSTYYDRCGNPFATSDYAFDGNSFTCRGKPVSGDETACFQATQCSVAGCQ